MPIDVLLSVPAGGKTAQHLLLCASLHDALSVAKVSEQLLLIDAKSALLLEDVYGHTHTPPDSDELLWRTENARPVLHEADLRDGEKEGYLGKWNLDFLTWLRQIAVAVSEPVAVAYEHERGDTPYESAWWTCDPLSETGEVETFGIQSNDGMDKPEWRAEVVRCADGRIEIR